MSTCTGFHLLFLLRTALIAYQTLIKALRFCTTRDLYNPAESVLRTITRDTVTLRARDIKPGEVVDSVWDTIQKGKMSSWMVDNATRESTECHEPDLSKYYNEADVLEDAILFPEQSALETVGGLFRGHETSMQEFMSKGPDWTRFIGDLGTDEEYEASDAETEFSLEDQIVTKESGESSKEESKRLVKVGKHSHKSDKSSWDSLDYEAGSSDDETPLSEEELECLALLENWKSPKIQKEDIEKQFFTFLDREKSKGKSRIFVAPLRL